MKGKIRIGISACLLGKKVRYDGGDRLDPFLIDALGKYVEWEAVCPETECGLPVPREPMRLEGDPRSPRLVTTLTMIDHTKGMHEWAEKKVREIQRLDICGFVLKSRSPSCSMQGIKVYGPSGLPVAESRGIFAAAVMDRFPLLPVEDEERLRDHSVRRNFIERVVAFSRRKERAGKKPPVCCTRGSSGRQAR